MNNITEDNGIEIYNKVFGKDFDDVDKDIINQQIAKANTDDINEEDAKVFGY